jgi:hypothetical protein
LQGNGLGIKVGMVVIDMDKGQLIGLGNFTRALHTELIGGTAATGEGEGKKDGGNFLGEAHGPSIQGV